MKKNNHDLGLITGKYINLREVTVDDAEFILRLRTSEKAQHFLHHTDPDIEKQREYIRIYLTLEYEWYFLVVDKTGRPVGCLSAYDRQGDSVSTGRWLMKRGLPVQYGIESDILLKRFLFESVGVGFLRADTRVDNKNIQNFVKMFGYKETHRIGKDIFYMLDKETYLRQLPMVERFCR